MYKKSPLHKRLQFVTSFYSELMHYYSIICNLYKKFYVIN